MGEEELILHLAGTRERRAAARLEDVDWAVLLAELEYQRLAPLIGRRVIEAAGGSVPADFADAVSQATASAGDAGALLELMTLRIATALEADGVANVPLKGPLLARALHGDPGMRESRDVDVLVSRQNLGRAVDALAPLGWRPAAGEGPDPALHVVLVHESGLPDIEVHWRLHWYEAEFGARALARAQKGADGIRRLRPEDNLAALMLYYARDGFAGLRHPIDTAAWWDAHGGACHGPVVEEIAGAHPALRCALTASAVLLERFVGVPARRLIGLPAHLSWGAERAVALANPFMRGRPQQITAEVSLVDGLLSPRGERTAFLRRRALPTARDLAPMPAGRSLALARADHILRVVRRYALAVVRPRPGAR
jgi:Uncharacterised nucleotidyltransferase